MKRRARDSGYPLKPYTGQRFYLSITNKSVEKTLRDDLLLLGAEVDACFSNVITRVVADADAPLHPGSSGTPSPGTPGLPSPGSPLPSPHSPSTSALSNQMSRAAKIMGKACVTKHRGTANLLQSTERLNIPVFSSAYMRQEIDHHLARIPTTSAKHRTQAEKGLHVKKLPSSWLKFEDASLRYRPVTEQITNRPQLCLTAVSAGCPFTMHANSGAGDMEQNPTIAEQGTKAETVTKTSMAPGPSAVEAVKPTPTTRQLPKRNAPQSSRQHVEQRTMLKPPEPATIAPQTVSRTQGGAGNYEQTKLITSQPKAIASQAKAPSTRERTREPQRQRKARVQTEQAPIPEMATAAKSRDQLPEIAGEGSREVKAKSRDTRVDNKNRRRRPTAEEKKKRGYCEMCAVTFDDFAKHRVSDSHMAYVDEPSNFVQLDTLLASVSPHMASFLRDTLTYQSEHRRQFIAETEMQAEVQLLKDSIPVSGGESESDKASGLLLLSAAAAATSSKQPRSDAMTTEQLVRPLVELERERGEEKSATSSKRTSTTEVAVVVNEGHSNVVKGGHLPRPSNAIVHGNVTGHSNAIVSEVVTDTLTVSKAANTKETVQKAANNEEQVQKAASNKAPVQKAAKRVSSRNQNAADVRTSEEVDKGGGYCRTSQVVEDTTVIEAQNVTSIETQNTGASDREAMTKQTESLQHLCNNTLSQLDSKQNQSASPLRKRPTRGSTAEKATLVSPSSKTISNSSTPSKRETRQGSNNSTNTMTAQHPKAECIDGKSQASPARQSRSRTKATMASPSASRQMDLPTSPARQTEPPTTPSRQLRSKNSVSAGSPASLQTKPSPVKSPSLEMRSLTKRKAASEQKQNENSQNTKRDSSFVSPRGAAVSLFSTPQPSPGKRTRRTVAQASTVTCVKTETYASPTRITRKTMRSTTLESDRTPEPSPKRARTLSKAPPQSPSQQVDSTQVLLSPKRCTVSVKRMGLNGGSVSKVADSSTPKRIKIAHENEVISSPKTRLQDSPRSPRLRAKRSSNHAKNAIDFNSVDQSTPSKTISSTKLSASPSKTVPCADTPENRTSKLDVDKDAPKTPKRTSFSSPPIDVAALGRYSSALKDLDWSNIQFGSRRSTVTTPKSSKGTPMKEAKTSKGTPLKEAKTSQGTPSKDTKKGKMRGGSKTVKGGHGVNSGIVNEGCEPNSIFGQPDSPSSSGAAEALSIRPSAPAIEPMLLNGDVDISELGNKEEDKSNENGDDTLIETGNPMGNESNGANCEKFKKVHRMLDARVMLSKSEVENYMQTPHTRIPVDHPCPSNHIEDHDDKQQNHNEEPENDQHLDIECDSNVSIDVPHKLKNKVKRRLNSSIHVLSARSVSVLLTSDPAHDGFKGFTSFAESSDSGLSYEEMSEVELTDHSEIEWVFDEHKRPNDNQDNANQKLSSVVAVDGLLNGNAILKKSLDARDPTEENGTILQDIFNGLQQEADSDPFLTSPLKPPSLIFDPRSPIRRHQHTTSTPLQPNRISQVISTPPQRSSPRAKTSDSALRQCGLFTALSAHTKSCDGRVQRRSEEITKDSKDVQQEQEPRKKRDRRRRKGSRQYSESQNVIENGSDHRQERLQAKRSSVNGHQDKEADEKVQHAENDTVVSKRLGLSKSRTTDAKTPKRRSSTRQSTLKECSSIGNASDSDAPSSGRASPSLSKVRMLRTIAARSRPDGSLTKGSDKENINQNNGNELEIFPLEVRARSPKSVSGDRPDLAEQDIALPSNKRRSLSHDAYLESSRSDKRTDDKKDTRTDNHVSSRIANGLPHLDSLINDTTTSHDLCKPAHEAAQFAMNSSDIDESEGDNMQQLSSEVDSEISFNYKSPEQKRISLKTASQHVTNCKNEKISREPNNRSAPNLERAHVNTSPPVLGSIPDQPPVLTRISPELPYPSQLPVGESALLSPVKSPPSLQPESPFLSSALPDLTTRQLASPPSEPPPLLPVSPPRKPPSMPLAPSPSFAPPPLQLASPLTCTQTPPSQFSTKLLSSPPTLQPFTHEDTLRDVSNMPNALKPEASIDSHAEAHPCHLNRSVKLGLLAAKIARKGGCLCNEHSNSQCHHK